MIIGRIKLGPNTPSWYDSVNNIHLMKPDRAERDITDKHDFAPIQQGIDNGKIVFKAVEQPVVEKPKAKKKKAKKAAPAAEQVHIDVHVTNENEGSDKE